MKPAPCSCRGVMWRSFEFGRPRYSSTVWTPGMPKTVSMPYSPSSSTSTSPHVAMTASFSDDASVAIDDARQHAQHLEQQVGAGERGVAGRVVGWRDLDEIAADKIEAAAAADDLECLRCRQAADLRRARAGRVGGVEAV